MKPFLPFFLLIFSISAFAQIPSYYNDVDINLTGNSLQEELSTKIISTHTNYLSYADLWDVLSDADQNPNNSSEVILIYGYNDSDGEEKTDRTRDADQHGGSVGDWNREHSYAKSLGDPNLGESGPGSDAHHMRPCDMQANSTRNNNKFGEGSGTASYLNSNGDWYPGDEWIGDVARMMMYMYLRYEDQCLPSNVITGTSNSSDNDMINLLLEWNVEDPVSDLEEQRNDVIEDEQGNRNPFIDNPAFATAIWGGDQAEDLFGTSSSNNNSDDLFISEYVEGSSYNKAIEIANFTGSSVNLSSYSLYKTTNGNGTWASSYNLSGTLANGDVIVIAHSRETLISADATTNSGIMTFNGNDAVGLFKNGSLIDVVGNANSSANFGQNTTLRRVASVTDPNTSYNTSEWNSYASNTVSNLGSHTITSSKASFTKTAETSIAFNVNVYPNPTTDIINITLNNDEETNITIYNTFGQAVIKDNNVNDIIDVSHLPKGIYLLEINNGKDLFTDTIIKK